MKTTIQFWILTKLNHYISKENGICLNPFYGKTSSYVSMYEGEAKELYPLLFKEFITFWYILWQHGEIPSDLIPPKKWEMPIFFKENKK